MYDNKRNKKTGTLTNTYTMRGQFKTKTKLRDEFFSITKR